MTVLKLIETPSVLGSHWAGSYVHIVPKSRGVDLEYAKIFLEDV